MNKEFYLNQIKLYIEGGMPELLYLADNLKNFPGRIAIDAGARIGEISYFLATYEGITKVHAFEPNPTVIHQLKELEEIGVVVYEVALSDKDGSAKLYMPFDNRINRSNDGLSSLSVERLDKVHENYPKIDNKNLKVFDVITKRLDDYNFEDVKIIKIDVEGSEELVINGAEETIKRNRPLLIVEIDDNVSDERVSEKIKAFGYDCFWYDRKSNQLLERKGVEKISNVYNFIFIPRK